MTRLFSAMTDRFRRLSDTQLRIAYSTIAVISLSWIVITAVFFFRSNDSITMHTDDLAWKVREIDGAPRLFVTSIVRGGRAQQAGINVGDRIVAINGRIIEGDDISEYAQEILNTSPVEVPIPYVVERQGNVYQLTIYLKDITKSLSTTRTTGRHILLVFPIFATFWLLVGTMVALAQPRGVVQRRFFFTAATVIFAFSLPGATTSASSGITIGSTIWLPFTLLQFFFGVLFYPLWLRFCTTFPIDQKIFSTKARRVLLFLPIYLYLAIVAQLIAIAAIGTSDTTRMPPLLLTTTGIVLFLCVVCCGLYFYGGIFLLYIGYRRLPQTVDRRPMRTILIGTSLTGFALLYFISIVILDSLGRDIIPSLVYFYPVVLLLALPLAFGYAIFKYQLMDFRLVIKTTMVYTATMTLIAGLYLAVGYGIGQAFDLLFGRKFEGVVGVIGFVLFLMIFDPVKRRVQTAIENRFFPQRRDYSGRLAAYSAQLTETLGELGLAGLMARTLREGLELPDVQVILHESPSATGDRLRKAADREEDATRQTMDDGTPEEETPEDEAMHRLREILQESPGLVSLATLNNPLTEALRPRFAYAVGLHAQGRIIGVVLIGVSEESESISGSQTSFITNVVTQGAAAVELARLYEQEIARLRYQEDMATARRIQESLLPVTMPQIPGISVSALSRPAQAVGGDYYEVIRLDDSRLLVLVADVSGKGLPASLYMAELHGMVRIAGTRCETPSEVLATLNEHLHAGMSAGTFVTASIALFDSSDRTVSFVRAGHTPLLWVRDGRATTVVPRGMGLGLSSNKLFTKSLHQQTISYRAGDIFVLYSDGVSEAMNARNEEFGDDRLAHLLTNGPNDGVDRVRDRILHSIEEFRGGAEQNDDVTIVVIGIGETAEWEKGTESMIPEAAIAA